MVTIKRNFLAGPASPTAGMPAADRRETAQEAATILRDHLQNMLLNAALRALVWQ